MEWTEEAHQLLERAKRLVETPITKSYELCMNEAIDLVKIAVVWTAGYASQEQAQERIDPLSAAKQGLQRMEDCTLDGGNYEEGMYKLNWDMSMLAGNYRADPAFDNAYERRFFLFNFATFVFTKEILSTAPEQEYNVKYNELAIIDDGIRALSNESRRLAYYMKYRPILG